jgi:hypothetical protein
MPRPSVVAEIFGYLVCLLAVVIFFASIAGIINGAFHIAHPTPHSPAMFQRSTAGRQGHLWSGPMIKTPQPPNAFPAPSGANAPFMSDRLMADARYDAVRRFVLSVVMLVVSIAVFNRAFGWLNPKQSVPT